MPNLKPRGINFSKIPQKNGVYFFYGQNNKLLYIGKANDLQARIRSHFSSHSLPPAKSQMIANIKKIKWQITASDIEALIKEAELIKRYQPFYNITLRDDKNYFFVEVTSESFPRIYLTHQPKDSKNIKNIYIGPFTDGAAIKIALNFLRKIFPYCTCTQAHARRCINAELDKCLDFCCNKNFLNDSRKDLKKEYHKNIKSLIAVLTGKKQVLIKTLKKEMVLASSNNNFEKASKIRDQLMGLERIFQHRPVLKVQSRETLLKQEILTGIKALLNLPSLPHRIEIYDVSNIQGKMATGSMIVFEKGQPQKNEYKKFRIRACKESNDTAMIKEVLGRRLAHREWQQPDLFVIDGGRGQLNAALFVIRSKGLKTPIAALAKKEEELYIEKRPVPLELKMADQKILHLFQSMRNEAHRFAVGYHKKLRKSAIIK